MGRTVASETAGSEGFDALAAAHSRALAKMSADIRGGDPDDGRDETLGARPSNRSRRR